MKIAILGWGSLIRDQRNHSLQDGWHQNGPTIPIEFSRITQHGDKEGCLTLVIDERNGTMCPTYYGISTNTSLPLTPTIDELCEREGVTNKNRISYCEIFSGGMMITYDSRSMEKRPVTARNISRWAIDHNIDAVVYTGLGPKFKDILHVPFNNDTALNYISSLSPNKKIRAIEYIVNSPESSMTSFRRHLIENQSRLV